MPTLTGALPHLNSSLLLALLATGMLLSSSCDNELRPSDNIAKGDPEIHRGENADSNPTRLHGGRQGRGPWMED